MSNESSLQKIASEIRNIYAAEPLQAEAGIERYLKLRLRSLPEAKKIAVLQKLTNAFSPSGFNNAEASANDEEVLAKLFALVLGGKTADLDLSSTELIQRLAESLNTIFDKLNQLVGLINSTFHGQTTGEETIRQVIGGHLEGDPKLESLESYLDQINKAFLTTQQAFKHAAQKLVSSVLGELDPERITDSAEGGLKFGPLRKAQLFEIYENKYGICRQWFESGRFMETFLREFEKNCRAQ